MGTQNCKTCLITAALSVASFFAGTQVQAQFAPPPPVISTSSEGGSFTDKDREMLRAVYRMVRAIRAKLFPLEEEQQILKLTP
jgi:hypothetical protein